MLTANIMITAYMFYKKKLIVVKELFFYLIFVPCIYNCLNKQCMFTTFFFMQAYQKISYCMLK